MGDFSYKEDYAGHQGALGQCEAEQKPDILPFPPGLDDDLFTDEQLEHLLVWWQDARRDTVNKLLAFLLQPKQKRPKLKARLVLLDKMLNRPDLKWSETAAAYGVSQHTLYNVKNQVEKEVWTKNPRAASLLFPRGHAKRNREKTQNDA